MELKRIVSKIGMLFISVGAMIGSGWLFGPLYAAQIAGPAAVIAWTIGGILIFIVALNFAELAAMLPITGGIARFPQFSHGPLVSFVMTWIAWVAYVLLAPIEIMALLQYASNYLPWLVNTVNGKPELTGSGYGIATVLLLLLSLLNIYGIRLVSRFNVLLVWIKLLLPALTAVTLIMVLFHIHNFTSHISGGFMPYGIKSILTSLPAAGIIFSFFGFRVSIEIAGEAKNPQRSLPLSLLGSIIICILLYTLVQFAFIGGISPDHLTQGWDHLSFKGDAGPFVGLAAPLGLIWLIVILYVDAVVSPFGSALMVVTTNSRLGYAMSVNGYAPQMLKSLNKRGVPHIVVIVNLIVGMILLLPFPGWQKLASFILSALVFSHAITPICLVALRKQIPHQHRPFRLPGGTYTAFLAFTILNLVAYWTGFSTVWKMYVVGIIGLIFLLIFRAIQGKDKPRLHSKQAIWLIPYFGGMLILSYLGSFGGGRNLIPFGWDFLIIIAFSIVIFLLGVNQRLSPQETEQQLQREKQLLPFMPQEEMV